MSQASMSSVTERGPLRSAWRSARRLGSDKTLKSRATASSWAAERSLFFRVDILLYGNIVIYMTTAQAASEKLSVTSIAPLALHQSIVSGHKLHLLDVR